MGRSYGIIQVKDKTLDQINAEELMPIRDYFLSITGENGVVQKENIRAEKLGKYLAHLTIVEKLNDHENRFRIRLVGEEMRNKSLGYISGAYLENVTPDFYSEMLIAEYGRVLDEGQSKAQDIVWNYENNVLDIERILIPMIKTGDSTPTQVLISTKRSEATEKYMQVERKFDE